MLLLVSCRNLQLQNKLQHVAGEHLVKQLSEHKLKLAPSYVTATLHTYTVLDSVRLSAGLQQVFIAALLPLTPGCSHAWPQFH